MTQTCAQDFNFHYVRGLETQNCHEMDLVSNQNEAQFHFRATMKILQILARGTLFLSLRIISAEIMSPWKRHLLSCFWYFSKQKKKSYLNWKIILWHRMEFERHIHDINHLILSVCWRCTKWQMQSDRLLCLKIVSLAWHFQSLLLTQRRNHRVM